jgi:hypothetical protein
MRTFERLAQQDEVSECNETVTFTDDDLMLGEKQHNRPLFVSGDLAGERVNRILLDPGGAVNVNILPLNTLERIGFTPSQLKSTSLTIHGFNSGGQGSLGSILLDIDIQGFLTQVNCHVIDAPTSYNLLLGRPWLHRYKVVPSTAHQCFKYCKDGIQRRVAADMKPFAVTETYFAQGIMTNTPMKSRRLHHQSEER